MYRSTQESLSNNNKFALLRSDWLKIRKSSQRISLSLIFLSSPSLFGKAAAPFLESRGDCDTDSVFFFSP